jgi:hypothetical protein
MALRLKSKNPCRLIWPVQSAPEKYSGFHRSQISGLSRPFRSGKGALAIVTNVGTGCGGRSSVVTCFFAWTNDAIADGEVVWS